MRLTVAKFWFLSLFLRWVDCQNAPNDDKSRGQCLWYKECDVENEFHRYCPYDGPPMKLTNQKALETLTTLCPDLVKEASANNEFCCDAVQIATLLRSMTLPQQLFARCPSCTRNFRQLWCQSTCSPRQTDFMQVSETSWSPRTNRSFVSRVDLLSGGLVSEMFRSCRSVLYSGKPAVDLMCSGKTGDQCTAQSFAQFLGHNSMAPFIVDFAFYNESSVVVGNKTFHPLNATTFPCSAMTPELDLPCSCQDCRESCPPSLPYPDIAEGKCYVGSIECMVFVSLLAFVGLCFLIVLMSVLHYVISSSTVDDFAPSADDPANQKHGVSDDGYFKSSSGASLVNDSEVTVCEKVGCWLEAKLEAVCYRWGRLCTKHPVLVFMFGLSVSVLCSCGICRLNITTDPVALWSSPNSQGRSEKNFFDETFGPFYRTAQIIVVPKDQSSFKPKLPPVNKLLLGPAFRKEVLEQILKLQTSVESLTGAYQGGNVSLKSICVKPLQPDSSECLVQSPLGWFQNSVENLNKIILDEFDDPEFDYISHILACIESPTLTNDTKFNISCLAPYGGPVFPYVAIGNFTKENYSTASAFVLTYLITNNLESSKNGPAESWENSFVQFMKNYSNPIFDLAFISERSIQDEITRESQSDVATILISYLVMFVYIAFSLGQYGVYAGHLSYFLVQSKIILGFVGVLIVMLSVTSSVGIFSLAGIPATLIIIEVVPFLVLAVGVDNIFILVQTYQRDVHRKNEPVEDRMGRICGEVIPTMLLSSLSECFCFMLGALSTMPAVKTFSLYAGLAILFDFFLQVTCFAALFTVDVRRQEAGRLELCCCVRLAPPSPTAVAQEEGFLYCLVRDYYTPFLLRKPVKFSVLIVFIIWLCSSLSVINKIDVGLDQSLAMPEDSYVLKYFGFMTQYLSVGPPVYFVIKGNLDYSKIAKQNLICGSSGCKSDSLVSQIYTASVWSNNEFYLVERQFFRSYVAQPALSWLDDYFDWLRPVGDPPCCRVLNTDNSTFCPSTVQKTLCSPCGALYIGGRPDPTVFYHYLPAFLSDNPGFKCAKGASACLRGHAAYSAALKLSPDSNVSGSHFMTYHTVLKTPQDYTNALRNARHISENISRTIDQPGVQVFPYSIFYVFYEQYLTVVHDAILQLIVSLVGIFFVTTVLLGLDPWSAVMIVTTIVLILVNMMGLMYWWSISFNAISLVNLVMSVGISVEFCAHLVRAFKINCQPTRTERAKEALSSMGSSVLSGITLTKFGGIVVLAFSHSQIFQVFYFRMYMGIVLIGATHGLIFLPIFLSLAGPSLSRYRQMNQFKMSNSTPASHHPQHQHHRHSSSSTSMFDQDAAGISPTTIP